MSDDHPLVEQAQDHLKRLHQALEAVKLEMQVNADRWWDVVLQKRGCRR